MPDGQREGNGHGAGPLVVDTETEKFLREMRVCVQHHCAY